MNWIIFDEVLKHLSIGIGIFLGCVIAWIIVAIGHTIFVPDKTSVKLKIKGD